MVAAIGSFWRGWGTAARMWPAVLLLYLVDAALALILTIPPASYLSQAFGHSSMASELLGPITVNLLLEAGGPEGPVGFPWSLYLLVPLISFLVGTFLRGGVLETLARGPGPFRWDTFFAGCARLFRRLLLLMFFYLPGMILLALLFLLGNLAIGLATRGDESLVSALALRGGLLSLLLLLLAAALDYARISLALEPQRSLWRHAGRSLRFLVKRFPSVLLLALAFGLALGAIGLIYPASQSLPDLFGRLLPALILQQVALLAASWQRVASLAGEMALFRSRA